MIGKGASLAASGVVGDDINATLRAQATTATTSRPLP